MLGKQQFVIILTLAALAGTGLPAHAGDALTLTWVTDNTPGGHYIVGGGEDFRPDLPGAEIELYRLVAHRLGFEVRFRRMPWKQCLFQVQTNRVDGVFPASYKPARQKIGVYPMRDGAVDLERKTRDTAYYLYTLRSSGLSWDGRAFSGQKGVIAAPAGWAVVEDLRSQGVEVKEVPVHAASPDMLVLKRVQGFLCLDTVFDTYLQGDPVKYREVVKIQPPLLETPYYLLLSRGFVQAHPELAQEIWDTIRVVRQSAEYEAILSKYLE